ncbi:hypothetical protein T484DRAFT_1789201 [Baffinella frigidus]|nr:hypothetical protein T484DRAFT_1789201 [Cryptophyta sp. CCMP2293]
MCGHWHVFCTQRPASYGIVKCGSNSANKIFPQCKGGAVQARPFIEFRWANELRKKFYSTGIYRESDQAQPGC